MVGGQFLFHECRVRSWHVFVLFLLGAAQVGAGVLASIASSDTNRDIYFAQQIAAASYFPLIGPPINFTLHNGPLWYYLMAIPLWLVPNAAAVTGFMAILSALQFPLAYEVGRRFGSAREGLLFALALAMPGWMTVSLASLTHTIAVVPSLLLGVLATLWYRETPDLKRAGLVALACVFMLMAHPTLILMAFLLVLACAERAPTATRRISHGLVVMGLSLLAVAPSIYAQWQLGLDNATNTAQYVQTEWSVPSLLKAGSLLYSILWFGPKYVAYFLLELPPHWARAMILVCRLVLAIAATGLAMRLWTQPSKRTLILSLLALLLVQSIFVCAIRVAMPPWMIYAQWPLIGALTALGLEYFCAWNSGGRILVGAGLLCTTLLTFDVYANLARGSLDHAEITAPAGSRGVTDVLDFPDIRDYAEFKYESRLARLPFRQLFAIGEPLCKPTALFGHYAYLVDTTFAVSAWANCGEADTVQFGGIPSTGQRALLGLHHSVWRQIGFTPELSIGELGISQPTAIWRSQRPLKPVAPLLTAFPRSLSTPVHEITVSGDALSDQAVLVSQRMHRYAQFEGVRARVDGIEVKPAYADSTAVIFLSPSREANNLVHWDIDLHASDYIDVLTFSSRPDADIH